ncbi:hypothetical protein [Thioalkalivibrio sp. HK1]|uniref:hypothetical protein n=1 Tax=Thioalkalivibrio sp. HK1 TaxID=1469245 RepID=UPI001E407F4E|nr:hypothetical protein [Thioalkalivibrio sp. HK1]
MISSRSALFYRVDTPAHSLQNEDTPPFYLFSKADSERRRYPRCDASGKTSNLRSHSQPPLLSCEHSMAVIANDPIIIDRTDGEKISRAPMSGDPTP